MKMFSVSLFAALMVASNGISNAALLNGQACSSCTPTQCGSCQTQCGSCQACGTGTGACCFPGEAIDIDSLTDKAVSKRLFESMQARLIFEVPEDVELTLSGMKMTTGGKERSFLVSVNNQKSTYRYDIRVDAVRGGKTYYKKQQIKTLRAGSILKIKVEAAKVADGEIPKIEMAIEPIMPGGPEKKADDKDAEEEEEEAEAADSDE